MPKVSDRIVIINERNGFIYFSDIVSFASALLVPVKMQPPLPIDLQTNEGIYYYYFTNDMIVGHLLRTIPCLNSKI